MTPSKVSENMEQHTEISMGLMYGILVADEDSSQSSQAQVSASLIVAVLQLPSFHSERFFQFLRLSIENAHFRKVPENVGLCPCSGTLGTCHWHQLMWLVNKLVEANVHEADILVSLLLRQIRGGDTSQKNLFLVHSTLQLLNDHKWASVW